MKRLRAFILAILVCTGTGGPLLSAAAETVSAGSPRRIVSLSPAVTEIVFALGAERSLQARTDYCDWPPQAAAIPSVGGFDGKATSLEKILSFRPDLVCVTAGMHDHLIAPLEKYGIGVFVSSADTVEDVLSEITELARITGCERSGDTLVAGIRAQLAQARALLRDGPPVRVFWEVSASPYFTCGKNSFINDVLACAGAVNVFADVTQPYPQVSEESIIARAPDVIIVPSYGGIDAAAAVLKRRAWENVPAVRNRNVFSVDADVVSRPGPRIGQAALLIAQLLYARDGNR
ncbi:cobalamin-binding protein [Treponema brennaborense]|uniref:ABC-type transporter, periplasmic subunit n=1 Tax=Treponema brennaborense (strain DSM 12168 / CIP 105900 / DD5/3) TaxID=906968 RepID=F4LNC5_TREBD|nr:cobalamin-binding protein [Treponema brennaborense]AEE17883.1 ABC-type transporter, periplasmic subunit [Treponema brennaborense DSM 12168]